MDELKISSSFMRNIVSKLLAKMVRKKFGYKVDIQLNELAVTINNGVAHVHVNADAEVDSNEFKKITKIIESED